MKNGTGFLPYIEIGFGKMNKIKVIAPIVIVCSVFIMYYSYSYKTRVSSNADLLSYMQNMFYCECYRKGMVDVVASKVDDFQILQNSVLKDERYWKIKVDTFGRNEIIISNGELKRDAMLSTSSIIYNARSKNYHFIHGLCVDNEFIILNSSFN